MRTIGLIGGMSWESTRIYYELLNRGVQRRLGGLHSAKILLSSLDMAQIDALQREGRWEEAGAWLAQEAMRLERAGAEVLALATNTMHKCAPHVLSAITVPFLHIIDPLVANLQSDRRTRPLLLATRFTMEERFFLERLEMAELSPLVPSPEDRIALHRIIFEELCRGVVSKAAAETARRMISDARSQGADSVILGCTELGLLIGPESVALPPYDTAAIHAGALVDFALRGCSQ